MRLPGLMTLLALPVAAAAEFVPVSDRESFVALLDGKDLRQSVLGITLKVAPGGTITGKAVTWGVTGTWDWQGRYFCREMDWTGMAIPFNCQLVEIDGDRMRFTVDQGAGDSATFSLR